MFKQTLTAAVVAIGMITAIPAGADNYRIDTAHSSIKFKISHLGYSWLYGRFNTFKGNFSYDGSNPMAAKVSVEIDPSSVDSSHAERDKHIRSDDFLDVSKFPKVEFVSTGFTEQGNGKALLEGKLTLHGITEPISIDVVHVGAGKDPWGNYRRGFEGRTRLTLKDWGITTDLGPASTQLEMILDIEGVKM